MKKKKKENLHKLNEDAYEDLILSINREIEVGRFVFQLVHGSITDALSDGDSKEAWARLTGKFEAHTAPSRLLLKSKINSLRLKYKQDPEMFISVLGDLVLQYNQAGGNWSDEDTLERICGNLPSVYEVVIQPIEKKIVVSTNSLTEKELREELNSKYQKLNAGRYEVCLIKMKTKLVCLLEDSKESAIIVERLAINLKSVEHKAEVHMQAKVVETKILTRI